MFYFQVVNCLSRQAPVTLGPEAGTTHGGRVTAVTVARREEETVLCRTSLLFSRYKLHQSRGANMNTFLPKCFYILIPATKGPPQPLTRPHPRPRLVPNSDAPDPGSGGIGTLPAHAAI